MSYQDTLDRRACIRSAKKELEDFSDLLKLHTSNYDVKSIRYDQITKIISYCNYDHQQIKSIDRIDKQLEFINKMIEMVNKLDIEEIELLYLKYISMKTNKEIYSLLALSESKFYRKFHDALYKFSIAAGIEVYIN